MTVGTFLVTNRREVEDSVRFDLLFNGEPIFTDGKPLFQYVPFMKAFNHVLLNITVSDTFSYQKSNDESPEVRGEHPGALFLATHSQRQLDISKLPQEA